MAEFQGQAIASNGQGTVNTVKVANVMQGSKELILTYTNSAGGVTDTITIKSGAWRAASEILDGGGTNSMTAGDFSNNQQLQAYFRTVSSGIGDIYITTDDSSNLTTGYFQIIEKDPTGKEETITFRLSPKYVKALGGGTYALESLIPASAHGIVFWPGMELKFVGVKTGTMMSFTFNMKGWNKAQELSALKTSNLQ
jgi:hypothetical protein